MICFVSDYISQKIVEYARRYFHNDLYAIFETNASAPQFDSFTYGVYFCSINLATDENIWKFVY